MFYSIFLFHLFLLGSTAANDQPNQHLGQVHDNPFQEYILPQGFDLRVLDEKSPTLHIIKRQSSNATTTNSTTTSATTASATTANATTATIANATTTSTTKNNTKTTISSTPTVANVTSNATTTTQVQTNKTSTTPQKPLQQQVTNSTSTTAAPVTTPTTPSTNVTTTPTTNVTTTPPVGTNLTTTATAAPSTTPAPAIMGPFKISDINNRNYTFIEHTSFVDGMNGWDFMGLWLKFDLNNAGAQSPVPLPKTRSSSGVEGGGNAGGAAGSGTGGENGSGGQVNGDAPGGGTKNKIQPRQGNVGMTTAMPPMIQPDDNNWVFISYASRVAGTLKKSFENLSDGAVFFTFYIMQPSVEFTVSLVNKQNLNFVLFSNPKNGTWSKMWTTQAVNFTQQQTLSDKFTIIFNVNGIKPNSSKDRIVWVALHHIAVGGAMLPPKPTTTPSPVILPPGSLDDIKKISNSIWIALYVFLFFFLLAIAALIFLIVRGRCRKYGSSSRESDYDPNTAYRLDKVYDNPAYDANST